MSPSKSDVPWKNKLQGILFTSHWSQIIEKIINKINFPLLRTSVWQTFECRHQAGVYFHFSFHLLSLVFIRNYQKYWDFSLCFCKPSAQLHLRNDFLFYIKDRLAGNTAPSPTSSPRVEDPPWHRTEPTEELSTDTNQPKVASNLCQLPQQHSP